MRFFRKTNIDFIGKRYIWYTISATIILAGMISLAVRGLDYGIDFLGGTEIVIHFTNQVEIGNVRTALNTVMLGESEIKNFGSRNDILIRTRKQGPGSSVSNEIQGALRKQFSQNELTVIKEDKIGPKIGGELRLDALKSIFISLVVILIYLGFRFQFVYGAGAVAGLFHDVLLTLGLVSIVNGMSSYLNLEMTQTMVAAFLTLICFSNNDTVVIFDRIRENRKLYRTEGLISIFNRSINETLSRTIITSGTIFLVLLMIFFFGGEINRGFAFTLLIGVVTGTYSSIYVASALVVEWTLYKERRKNAQSKAIAPAS
ncbi:MAG: protein translocase subunit SecF [Bacteroidota bacterium]